MSGVNSFLVAAVLGLASAGGVYGIAEWLDSRPAPEVHDDSPTAPAEARLLWPLLEGHAEAGAQTPFVFVASAPEARDLELPAEAEWLTEAVGVVTLATGAACHIDGQDCPSVAEAADGPRFGRDGYNATKVQFWAFDTQGRLFATNAPRGAADLYELHPQYTALPRDAWYLGAGEAPNGTTNLPAFKGQARALLDGLPDGGIATTVTEQFRWYMDDALILTARVEGLVHAP